MNSIEAAGVTSPAIQVSGSSRVIAQNLLRGVLNKTPRDCTALPLRFLDDEQSLVV